VNQDESAGKAVEDHALRSRTGIIRSWSGEPFHMNYGVQSSRRFAALKGFISRYLRERGELPAGTHIARVRFGPDAQADVVSSIVGELVMRMDFPEPGGNSLGCDFAGRHVPEEATCPSPRFTSTGGYKVLLSGEFSSMASSWKEYLCIEATPAGVHLSSRGYELLAEAQGYAVEDGDGQTTYRLPAQIDGSDVHGIEDDWVIGGAMLPHDDEAEVTITSRKGVPDAKAWLTARGWNRVDGFDDAWRTIESAILRLERPA
jgi:hypothetical protein